MALLAFNLTGAPLVLGTGGPPLPVSVILPPSIIPPARGPARNVTSECQPNLIVDPAHGVVGGLTDAHYAALSAQLSAGLVDFEWTNEAEYLTSSLVVLEPGTVSGSRLRIFDDFLNTDALGALGWTPLTSGAGSAVAPFPATAGYPGILRLVTGTTAAGRAGLRMQPTSVMFNPITGKISIEWMASLNVLATAGQDYFINIGWSDNTTGTQGTDGIYFRYDFPTTNWFAVSRVAGVTAAAVNTGNLVTTGWRKYHIDLDPTGARFYMGPPGIMPAQVASIPVGSLPSGPLRLFGPHAIIRKQTGILSRALFVDYCLIDLDLQGVR